MMKKRVYLTNGGLADVLRLRRMLPPRRHEANLAFVTSAGEAPSLLENDPFDAGVLLLPADGMGEL